MRGGGFGDLADFWIEGLELPIGGKTYVVPEPSAETGLWLQTVWSAGVVMASAVANGEEPDAATRELAELDDDGEANLIERVLGAELLAELKADGVGPVKIKHVGLTAFYWVVLGEEPAKAYWQGRSPLSAVRPEGNREERRAAAKSSTRTRAASATPRPASRSGTKSLPTKQTSSKAKALRSRGSNSSNGGATSKPTSRRSTASTSGTKSS